MSTFFQQLVNGLSLGSIYAQTQEYPKAIEQLSRIDAGSAAGAKT